MIDSDLIDVESLDLSDDQTWLYSVPHDSGVKVDIMEWNLSCDWPNEDAEYLQMEQNLHHLLDNILKNNVLSIPEKHKFDSRTFVKPKKHVTRPSIQSIVESSNPCSMSPSSSLNPSIHNPSNKYLTYNKYSNPLGAMSPMLRLKTFNVDANTENSSAVKQFAMKRRSLVSEDDPQLEDADTTLSEETSGRRSMEHSTPSKPINIDLSQPAHNIHNTFNKGLTNMLNERGSLNMYQSGESLMRMSPPSLVSSLLMENSGNFNSETLEGRKSMPSHRDSGLPMSGRESIDPMMTSMTLSILDEKDMSTSFLSQTTYHDNDSLIDSLPPSLVNSVNSSYIVSTSKPKDDSQSSIFSSATFTHLEQSEKLLSARPRCHFYNSFRRESGIKNSESYTKSREEACQIDPAKVLNATDNKETKPKVDMAETITLHYANNKYRSDAEKENFERDDAFYKDMSLTKPEDVGKNSLNSTMGKQELNEIIQARQKLSLARKGLPEPDKLPNQVETSPIKTIQLPNQIVTVPRQSMENASELLSRRRVNGFDKEPTREPPKRNATFKKLSPKASAMDATMVYVKEEAQVNDIIDINSATFHLIEGAERTLQDEDWGSQERAMVGSNESTDTGTFSSSSPPDSVPDVPPHHDPRSEVSSTPLTSVRTKVLNDLLNLHTTISPIYDVVDDKSYTVTKVSGSPLERTYEMNNTVINSATILKKGAKRDILTQVSPERKLASNPQIKSPSGIRVPPAVSYAMPPSAAVPKKTNLPTSKLRQYSSHRELSRIPAGPPPSPLRGLPASRSMLRRNVYASNPALSPTASAPIDASASGPPPPTSLRGLPAGRSMLRRNVYASNPALSPTKSTPIDPYATAVQAQQVDEKPARPVLTNPPPLVRQGTETLRRERPQSQLQAPRDLRASGVPMPASMRNHQFPPSASRPNSIAGASQLRVTRPASGPVQKPIPAVPVIDQPRPASSNDQRLSGLPRPSRLPGPRRTLRPPSTVYSVAPTGDAENY